MESRDFGDDDVPQDGLGLGLENINNGDRLATSNEPPPAGPSPGGARALRENRAKTAGHGFHDHAHDA